MLFELDFAALLTRQPVAAQPVSRLQPVRRDFAFVVDESVEARCWRRLRR